MDDTKIVKPGDEIKPEWWWATEPTEDELELARRVSREHAWELRELAALEDE